MRIVSNAPPFRQPSGPGRGCRETRERLLSGPRGAHVYAPSRRTQSRGGGWKAVDSRESRADSWKGPLLTFSCRHRPGWAGDSDRTKRGRTLEKRSGQRGSQGGGRETRLTDTPSPPGRVALSRALTPALVEHLQQRRKLGVLTDPEELEL